MQHVGNLKNYIVEAREEEGHEKLGGKKELGNHAEVFGSRTWHARVDVKATIKKQNKTWCSHKSKRLKEDQAQYLNIRVQVGMVQILSEAPAMTHSFTD